MVRDEHLFTSESVTEGHPDKIADQVSDAVLDAVIRQDPTGRGACETLLTTGLVVVAGGITTNCYVGNPRGARAANPENRHTRAQDGVGFQTWGALPAPHEQTAGNPPGAGH